MCTRNQTNAEFVNEVHEILGRHESSIDKVDATLQTLEINPFASTESSQHVNLPSANNSQPSTDRKHHYLKLNFPKFDGNDPQGWFAKLKGPVTWIEFTKALLLRFGPTDYEDPLEAFTRLKQTTIVSAYQEEFEKLSHRVDELAEKFLVGCFIAGLKDDIRLDVKIKQPCSLTDAIGVA
ncbi:hypothetical protein ACOSQ2_030832 [Xanthoceras sorbifolium]